MLRPLSETVNRQPLLRCIMDLSNQAFQQGNYTYMIREPPFRVLITPYLPRPMILQVDPKP